MSKNRSTPDELRDLAKEISRDQRESKPAEKRLKIKGGFKNAIKKMGRTPPPRKESK